MALYVAVHKHAADRCPAQDPQMGEMLLQHLSSSNAQKSGITIHGEAVAKGGHQLFLILDAKDQQVVRQFLTPFSMAGSVDIIPASPCEEVVANRGC
jgi:hypothetical protein